MFRLAFPTRAEGFSPSIVPRPQPSALAVFSGGLGIRPFFLKEKTQVT